MLRNDSSENILSAEETEVFRNREAMSSWVSYLKLITVEPAMFLYMMAFMLTSVIEQAFFIHKACKIDLGFSDEVCKNLTMDKKKNEQVQIVVTTFQQFNDIASHIIPMILALFIGAWSDRRGRKLLLLLGLTGKLWYSVWIIINSTQDTWTLNTIIWTASLPSGLTGGDLSVFAATFAYLSDITTTENRTMRITILDVVYLVSMPVGVTLGKYFFSYFNESYTILFLLNSGLLLVALVYSLIVLEWATNKHQKPLKLCCFNPPNKFADPKEREREKENKQVNCLLDFFDKKLLIDSLKAIGKWRPNHGRSYLLILLLAMGLYTFQRDEKQLVYFYTNLKFNWDINAFSDFRVFQSGIYVLGTLLCIPLMGKRIKLEDTTMLMIGTAGHSIARVVFALAEKPWLFYLGASFAAVGPIIPSVLRSMASKIVPVHERGKIFAILSVTDTTIPLISGVVYTQVYNASISTYPPAIFWVTIATQLVVSIVAIIIKCTNKNKSLECSDEAHSP